jgi:vacuolar-type H+-ATPase subunit H
LVFQSAKDSKKSTMVGADFKDLELVKRAEKESIQGIASANKKAESLIAKSELAIKAYEEKAISDLKKKLDKEFSLLEQQAIAQAKKIKAEGEKEANDLKQKTRGNVPRAVDYIVSNIVNE